MGKDPPNQIAIITLFRLADTDADGLLDDEEFALAQHLIKVRKMHFLLYFWILCMIWL